MSTPPVSSGPGLSDREAALRLAAEGGNELPRAGRRTLLRIVVGVIREPMFALLLGAGVIYLFLGDLREGLLLFAFATISSAIAVIQENRSEKVLDALRDLTSPRALVIRSGTRKRIAGREVVRGDLLVLSEGDRVPADALLRSAHDLQIDESLITGESVPVRKLAGPAPAGNVRPGGDDLPVVFSGTMVVRGLGTAEVLATGARSEIGKIGAALIAIESEPTQLTLQTHHIVKVAAIAGIAVSSTFTLIDALVRGGWLNGLLGGIALTMAMLPEEFPLVLTVFTVMGAWRISRAGADAARGDNRNARRRHGAMHRQDRHADAKSDVDCRNARGQDGIQDGTRRAAAGGDCWADSLWRAGERRESVRSHG